MIRKALVIFTRVLAVIDYQLAGPQTPRACEQHTHARISIVEGRGSHRRAVA